MTLNRYLEHEEKDYNHRLHVSLSSQNSLPRTLPSIDRMKVSYHPAILSTQYRFGPEALQWPKHWLGEPTTVIHRAAWRGLLHSNPIEPVRLGDRNFQRGIDPILQRKIVDFIRLWARAAPRSRR